MRQVIVRAGVGGLLAGGMPQLAGLCQPGRHHTGLTVDEYLKLL